MLASFWLDTWLFGGGGDGRLAFGLVLSNTLLHLLCTLLVLQLLLHLLGHGWPAWLGGLGFAALACHAEVLWYVSGRTDSMAALGFLLGLALHLRCLGGPGALRTLAVPAFALALFSKELSVAMPLLALLAQRWGQPTSPSDAPRPRLLELLRADRWIYGGYGLVLLLYLAARAHALGPQGAGGLPQPYFVRPDGLEFAQHLVLQLHSYLGNLFFAADTPPFLNASSHSRPPGRRSPRPSSCWGPECCCAAIRACAGSLCWRC